MIPVTVPLTDLARLIRVPCLRLLQKMLMRGPFSGMDLEIVLGMGLRVLRALMMAPVVARTQTVNLLLEAVVVRRYLAAVACGRLKQQEASCALNS